MRARSKPKLMKVAVLTAALQEITTREEQDQNPLLPVDRWLRLAKEVGADGIQLAAALHPDDSYVPREAMLDPVADHLPLRQDLSDGDANTIVGWALESGVEIFDLGVFENLLHPDDQIRAKIHTHLLRAARAAAKLRPAGCRGVAGFIGRDPTKDMDQQLALFEKQVIPLLKEFKKLGVTYWVEPCPMPGWNTLDTYLNNIGYCPGFWIALYKICKKHGVEDVLRITYDESHDILMGTTHHATFAAMKAAGLPFMVNRFHGKDQVSDPAKLALWNYRGQTAMLGDRHNGQPDPDPKKQCNAWGVMTANHGLPGLVHYNPANMAARRQVDWFDHQLGARRILGLKPENTVFIIEHEWGPARQQNLELVAAILATSVQYIRGLDAAAAASFEAERVCRKFGLVMPGSPNPMYDIPGLVKAARAIDPTPALAKSPAPETPPTTAPAPESPPATAETPPAGAPPTQAEMEDVAVRAARVLETAGLATAIIFPPTQPPAEAAATPEPTPGLAQGQGTEPPG